MPIDKSIFFDAFVEEGFLTEVLVKTGDSANKTIYGRYLAPAQVIFEGIAQSTEHSLRYRIKDAVLKRSDQLQIDGKTYRVTQPPKALGDGTTYVIVPLEIYKE